MRTSQPDEQKYKKILITLGIVIAICLFLPIIISPFIYIGSVLIIIGCAYLIYRYCLEYREQSDAKKVYDSVIVNEIYSVGGIAKDLGWDNAKTRRVIDFCFKNGYFNDYLRVGEELHKKEEGKDEIAVAANLSTVKRVKKCPHCGSVAEYNENEKSTCIYCGNVIDK